MVQLTRFEQRADRLATRRRFAARLVHAGLIWVALTAISLVIGMTGYAALEGMPAADAFVNAAMILSGMGPVSQLATTGGKIFAGCYALFSGLIIIIATGFVLAPIFHRVLHHFHLDSKGEG